MVGGAYPTAMADYRFPKRVRLLRASDFERVFAARSSSADARITMYGATNDLGYPRLGLTVSRRVGNAVVRSRWKRLLREAFRLTHEKLPPLDFVCVARGGPPPELKQLIDAMPKWARRIERRLKRDLPPSGNKTHE
jgi:ribonuclease P protein component